MSGSVRAWMETDHGRLSALLDAAGARSAVDMGAFGGFRAGLLRHIGIEEKILVPSLRELGAREADLQVARQMRLDHAALAALLVPTPTTEIVRAIRELLAVHNALEEGADGFYSACERAAGPRIEALHERLMRAPPVALAPYRDGPRQVQSIARLLRAAGRA